MIRKGIALIVMLLFVGMIISPSSSIIIEQVSESTSSGKTLYVGGSGPGNYTNIQDAIDNSSDGDTHRNTIYGNIIKDTDEIGIVISASWRNNIYRNNITNHSLGGIYISGFAGNSLYNSIYQNNIMDNNCGISIAPNLNGNAYDNIIYQNNFFNNRKNTHDITTNQWDNGKEGNYWDDYKGKDMDGDGIGDKPYRIRPRLFGNKDNYPLMKPYGNITCYPKKSQSVTTSNKQINKNNIPIGNLQVNNDTTPPVTTHLLNPPEPDGDNGWYVSNVEVKLEATDDSSGVKTIYYRISEGEWKNYSSDIVLFVLNHDCLIDGFIEYYAVDYAGNQEEIKSVNGIDIDQLPPEVINVTWKAYKEGGFWYVDFIVIAEDACSGIDRVEFLFNDGLHETITGRGPDYVFTFQWCVECRKLSFWFYCYDDVGNVAYVYIDPSDIKFYPDNQNHNTFFIRFFDKFPILQKILDVLRLNIR